MSTNTKNLGLFKYDPSTDKDEKFDISKALNENWDKVDNKFEDLDILVKKSESDIEEIISGNNIHLTDSTDNKVVDFRLYGKSKQFTTTGKNLLNNESTTLTHNGVKFTVNQDGSITANGTATDGHARIFIANKMQLPIGSYILSGCPAGGESTTYYLRIWLFRSDLTMIETYYTDKGSSIAFDITEEGIMADIFFNFDKDNIASNHTCYPMIRLASIEDDTWEPYTGGIASPNINYPQDIEISGESYNLLENTATSNTSYGVTFTVNEDKSVEINGILEATPVSFILNDNFNNILKIGERYILSGLPNNSNCYMQLKTSSGEVKVEASNGNPIEFEYDGTITDVRIVLRNKDAIFSNIVFYPMIRKASVKNNHYMPYGKGSVEVKSVGKNLLQTVNFGSKTVNDVTFIYNEDGSITANGTATAKTTLYISLKHMTDITPILGKEVIISGSIDVNKSYVQFYDAKNRVGRKETTFIMPKDENEYEWNCICEVTSGTTVNGTFYPMIRLASDTDNTWEPYKETVSTIPTPNGLAGIPVDSGGNYTDSNGQQWICDEIVKYADGSGALIQRIGKVVFDGSSDEKISAQGISNKDANAYRYLFDGVKDVAVYGVAQPNLCSHLKYEVVWNGTVGHFYNVSNNGFAVLVNFSTVEELRTWLASNPITFVYLYNNPITTPLTSEQLNEINDLSTFKSITTITNDFDCNMEVGYVKENIINTQTPIPVIPSSTRDELKSGDTVPTLFGKIKKWLSSIKPHAFTNPTNNLLATVTGTALDAVQGKVLYDRDVNMSVGRLGFQNKNGFGTLEEFVQETAKDVNTPIIVRLRDTTGAWGPGGNIQWYKCFVVYQNPYGSQYSLGGTGFMWDDVGNKWSIFINGNTNNQIKFTYDKLVTEAELNNSFKAKFSHIEYIPWTIIESGSYAEGAKRFAKSDAGQIKELIVVLQESNLYGGETFAYEYAIIKTGYSNLQNGYYQAITSKGVLRIYYSETEGYIDIRELPQGLRIRAALYLPRV